MSPLSPFCFVYIEFGFTCGGPCHLSSFTQCSGSLFSSENSLFIHKKYTFCFKLRSMSHKQSTGRQTHIKTTTQIFIQSGPEAENTCVSMLTCKAKLELALTMNFIAWTEIDWTIIGSDIQYLSHWWNQKTSGAAFKQWSKITLFSIKMWWNRKM